MKTDNRWMLQESKTKRNAFPCLSKHASEAFNLIFTLSNHFTHFKTILKFLTLSIFFPLLGFSLLRFSLLVTSLLCLVTPLYLYCDWTKFDKISCEINSRDAPWIKNSKTWRFWCICSDVLFKNLTRKKCVLVSEFISVKHRMCRIWSTRRWTDFSSLSRLRWSTSGSRLVVVLSWRSPGFISRWLLRPFFPK